VKPLAPSIRFLLRLAVSLALLGAILWVIDGAGLWHRLASVDFSWFALALALGILANIVSAWRWLLIARGLGQEARPAALFIAYGRGVTLNTVLPGATLGGDAYRAVALQRLGNPLLKSAASVALDRLSGLWALFVLSWCAWLVWAFVGDSSPQVVLLHLVGMAAAIAMPWFAGMALGLMKLPAEAWAARLLRLLSETAHFARMTLIPSLVVQLATIAALWAALQSVAAEFSALYLMAVAAPVFFIAALPVSIGGFGTREAALAGYWLLAGLPVEVAVAGALLHGFATTLQGVLWAPLFLVKRR